MTPVIIATSPVYFPAALYTNNPVRNNCFCSSYPILQQSILQPVFKHPRPRFSRPIRTQIAMETHQSSDPNSGSGSNQPMKLLFVEMGVGYDQHGQDITSAAMRACRDAISSNSIPAFRRGSIPGVTFGEMKLQIKLGVPRSLQPFLDINKVKSVFPYCCVDVSAIMALLNMPEPLFNVVTLSPSLSTNRSVVSHCCSGKILDVEVVDGGLICSSGVHVEEMGDKNDDCYIVNAAVYVGY